MWPDVPSPSDNFAGWPGRVEVRGPAGGLWAAAEGLKAAGCRGAGHWAAALVWSELSLAHQYIEYPLIRIRGKGA